MMHPPKIKLPDPQIPEKDIWEGALPGRAGCAQNIREMLADETEPLVVAVNGKWGCGKTYFLERFAREYEDNKHGGVCIYLNAWENDYLSNPLLFLLAGLTKGAKDQKKSQFFDSQTMEGIKKATKKAAWNLLGKVSFGVAEGMQEAWESTALAEYDEQTEWPCELKRNLADMADKIKTETHKHLIICVDELDRCRPTYAIEMLERIKHFFNIPGIVFMLGIDRTQLCASIASVYGNIDIENYLHRFFDIEFVLPPPSREEFIDSKFKEYGLVGYWKDLDSKGNTNVSMEEGILFRKVFHLFAMIHRLELREIQTAMKWLVIVVRTQRPRHFTFPALVLVLIVLKLRNRKVYGQYLAGLATPADVLDFILPRGPKNYREVDALAYERTVLAVYCSFKPRFEANPYVEAMRLVCNHGSLSAEEQLAMPWFFQDTESTFIQDMLKRIDSVSYGDSEYCGARALQHVASRLETLGWQDMQ